MSLVVSGGAMCLGMAVFFAQPLITEKLDEWRLLPRPERLTQLYFTDYRQLPATAAPGSRQTVVFTVHNLEHRTITYRYSLAAIPENRQATPALGSGTFTLPHGGSLKVKDTATLPATEGRVAVKVTLEYDGIVSGEDWLSDQKQAIHYWVTAGLKHQDKAINENT